METEDMNDISQRAQELIDIGMIRTILAMNDLLSTAQFKIGHYSHIHEEVQANDVGDGDNVPALAEEADKTTIGNKHVTDLIENLKPHIQNLLAESDVIKIWVAINIPKIQGGGNLSFLIQKTILYVLTYIHNEADSFFNRINTYYNSRAKLLKQSQEHPHIEDYRYKIRVRDETDYIAFQQVAYAIRNHYCYLYDVISKNIDRIKAPKTLNNSQTLYD